MSITISSPHSLTGSGPPVSWLVATRQYGKYQGSTVAMNVGCVLWSAGWALDYFAVNSPWVDILNVIGKVLTAAGLLVLLFAIRCPQCHNLTTFQFMVRSPYITCLGELKEATACPKCGGSPRTT